jgi:predicted O-methyltransferase YrrM
MLSYIVGVSTSKPHKWSPHNRLAAREVDMKYQEITYRSWQEFEKEQRRQVATFQLSLDELARDLYVDFDLDEDELKELNFD